MFCCQGIGVENSVKPRLFLHLGTRRLISLNPTGIENTHLLTGDTSIQSVGLTRGPNCCLIMDYNEPILMDK